MKPRPIVDNVRAAILLITAWWLLSLTVITTRAATLSPGYVIGGFGPNVFLDNAGTGGGDSLQVSGGDLGWVVQMTNLWQVGDVIRITGVALPVRPTTAAGTFTFNFYSLEQGADTNVFEGVSTETLVGSAQATLAAAVSSASAYSVTFDTPVVFTAASRGIAIQFTNSGGSLRVKINTASVAPNSVRLVSATGLQDTSGTAGNLNMRFTLAGSVVIPPAVGSLLWQGNNSADWDTTTTNWSRHLGGYSFTPEKYMDNGSFGPQVIFDDSLAAPALRTNINLTTGTPLRPSSLLFGNSTYRYDFSGPGKITGATILTNKGPGVVTLNTPNDFFGGSVLNGGRVRLGNTAGLGVGSIAFASGGLSSVGATPVTVTNRIILPGTAVLGHATDNGAITLQGIVDFNGGEGTIDAQSAVIISGVLTNGGLGAKTGPGTLTLNGTAAESSGSWQVRSGTLIVDGISVIRPTAAIQVGAAGINGTARLVITNGATITFVTNTTPLRLGVQGQSSQSSSNYLDLAGTLLFATNAPNTVRLGEASTYDELNLYPNSLLRAGAVEYVASAGGSNNTVININGGTIAAAASGTNFMSGHTAVNILPGGLTFDSESYTNTIRQSLLNGGGGLVKRGVGTLWLGGVNTYTGPTIVQAGTLGVYPGLSPDNVLTASAVVVSNGASIATDFVLAPGASVELTSLTLNGSGVNVHYGDLFGFVSSTIAFQGPSGSGVPLNVSGVNTIRLSGYAFGLGQYPVLQFSSRTGSGSFVASLPPGVIGTVATNGNQIVVNVTAAPKALSWFGSTDSATLNQNWNTASLNWNFAGAKYSENLGVGDYVTFDDTLFMFFDGVNSIPATNVNLTQPVAPVTMAVNSSYGYVFGTTGSGRITGITTLTKSNTGSLKLLTANDYSGGSTLASGPVLLGNNTALGTGPVTLSGAGLSSDSVSSRTIANPLLLGAATTFGDPINTGTLSWSGPADFGGGARDLNVLSDVVFSGSMTNGGLDEKTGPATLTFSGVTGSSTLGNWQVEDGKLVISGGNLIKSGGGIRIGSTIPSGIARLVITNNAVISVAGGGINARLGNDQTPAADISSTNILDLAGTLAWTTNNGGAVFIGQAGQRAELNLWPGGLLQFANFLPGGNTSVVNLNGGTLAPTSSRVDFMQGLTSAWVLPGGVTFDTKGFDVGVLQPLLNGGGGLTKIGNGTLALNGVNSYAGLTTVNGGSLGGTGVISGPVIVGASGTISPGNGIGTLTINNNLTLGGNVLIEINKSLAPASDTLAVTGTLAYGGTITVNNLGPALEVGNSFPVFPPGGTGSVTVVGNAGPGQAFSLNKTTGVISVVASLPSSTTLNYTNLGGGVIQLGWTGAFKLQWQTNAGSVGLSTNWSDYPNPSNPVNVTNNPGVPATFFRLINL